LLASDLRDLLVLLSIPTVVMEQDPPRRLSMGERMRYSVDQKTAPAYNGHEAGINYNDQEKGMVEPVDGLDGKPLLARALMGRHMQMIAIGMRSSFFVRFEQL
jgi:hypothetical protein